MKVDIIVTYDCGFNTDQLSTVIEVESKEKLPERLGVIRRFGIVVPFNSTSGIAIPAARIISINYSIQ